MEEKTLVFKAVEPVLKAIKIKSRFAFVGGCVRDALLKLKPDEFDIIVENPDEFNRIVARYKLKKYENFLTATGFFNNIRIDFSLPRTEFYKAPAKLPEVKIAQKIEDDLIRRDFTINSIAFDPVNGSFIDPFDGIGDIKRKLIKILHKNSFIDDPTRIFRAVRYKNRLKFKLDEITAESINDAVKYIKLLSDERIRYEIECILKEDSAVNTIKELKYLGVFRMLEIKIDERALNKTSNYETRIMLAFFYEPQKITELGFGKKYEEIVKLLKKVIKKPEHRDVAKLKSPELEVLKIIKGEKFVKKLINAIPEIDGNYLVRKGFKGCQIGNILNKIFELKLKGKIKSLNDEVNFVEKL